MSCSWHSVAIRAQGAAFPSVLLDFPSAEALQLRTQFPASRAFLIENVACGEGVGREGGGGVSAGGAGTIAVSCSVCILSLLCMASCFFTPLLLETTGCRERQDRAGGWWPGRNPWKHLRRVWVQALEKAVCVCVFPRCDPVPQRWLSEEGLSSQICPKPGQDAVVSVCSP